MFVVWSSQLGADEGDVAAAAELMRDPRAEHYWDGEDRVGAAFAPHVGDLEIPAWDVWMLFAPGVRWEGEGPPAPSHWEHQLSLLRDLPERRLDPERFAAKAVELARAAQR